jgi:hypothetical protein
MIRAHPCIHKMSQEERLIFWEVIISIIVSKKLYMYMCPIPNRFRDQATNHVLTRVAKCIDVDGGIFENVFYWVNEPNFMQFYLPLIYVSN